MQNKISQMREQVENERDFIDLMSTNFRDFTDSTASDLLKQAAEKYFSLQKYQPDSKGLPEARGAISKYYQETGQHCPAEKIIITASTSESYSLIFNSLLKPKSKVILPRPGYPLFEYLTEYSKLDKLFYELDAKNNWAPRLEPLKDEVSPGDCLVIIDPNNPTGSVLEPQTQQYLLDFAAEHRLILVVDEVFSDYRYSESDRPNWLEDKRSPLFLLNGISKTLALPDLKLAWIATGRGVPAKSLDALETANDCYLNCNYFSQYALPALLTHREQIQAPIKKILASNLNTLKQYRKTNLPAGGIHYLLELDIKGLQEEEIVLQLLEKNLVGTHPGYFYDFASEKPYLAISLLQNPENFAKGLSRISRFVIECNRSL